jgi:hypothetical protein
VWQAGGGERTDIAVTRDFEQPTAASFCDQQVPVLVKGESAWRSKSFNHNFNRNPIIVG